MASSSRTIPPLLEPYLHTLPTETADLVIATSILGASTNWLLLRYLYSFLKQSQHKPSEIVSQDDSDETNTTTTSVLLVSFLRDHTFWKEGAGRIGLDLDALTRAGRFGYIDGLSIDLFHSEGGSEGNARLSTGVSALPIAGRLPGGPTARASPIIPGRQQPAVMRGPIPVLGGRTPTPTTPAGGNTKSAETSQVLTNPGIAHIKKVIIDAVDKLGARARTAGKKSRVVLVIDQLDFLLAAAGGLGVGGEISAHALRELLLDLREMVDTTVLTLSADQPLIDEQNTTLEKEHANFVLSLAHEAAMVLSLRLLDTGVAKDVSGVIRITAGGDKLQGTVVEENEYLYHVRGDGSVKVFERGQ